ncbi:putative wound-induced protein, Wun1 [Lupinus albus]|uniref:Putative wound-induced protein, Wun1 n=1 Tax=Lupinus albus TaxID=3870 RepID=A0A6A4Q3D9_LUPAL|nr:putative wound-induced protein, Wun1 [Lupinus albus]
MHILTGEVSSVNNFYFHFVPQSVVSFGNTVIVEGCDGNRNISWVHAWTVSDGIITQVREYFNTALTVTRFGNSQFDSDSDSNSGSEIVPAVSDSARFTCVWESTVSNRVGKSVPGLVLAI